MQVLFNYQATTLQLLCNHYATIMQLLCSHYVTMEPVAWRSSGGAGADGGGDSSGPGSGRALELSVAAQGFNQRVELRAGVFAGDGEAEVAVGGSAGVFHKRREDPGREKQAAQEGGFTGALGTHGHDRPGGVGQWEAG